MSSSAVLTNPSVERVRAALERAGMPAAIVELPGAARTAKAAADFLGCEVAQIANSLVFRAEASDTAVLVMSSGRHTGFAIGGVAPVGHGVSKVFVEKALAAQGELWAAAGHPHTVFRLSYPQLLSITGGREAELAA